MKKNILFIAFILFSNICFSQFSADLGSNPAFNKIDYDKINPQLKTTDNVELTENAIYHLWLFGKNAEFPMWVIIDKTNADTKLFDKLYIDRDCDGTIGEIGESFNLDQNKPNLHIAIEEWKNPSTNEISTLNFTLFKRLNEIIFNGTIIVDKQITSFFAKHQAVNQKETASKIWIGFEKPLIITNDYMNTFSSEFYHGKGEIAGGPSTYSRDGTGAKFNRNERQINIAYPGTENTRWHMSQYFLPKDEIIELTLNYTDLKGNKRTHKDKLAERC